MSFGTFTKVGECGYCGVKARLHSWTDKDDYCIKCFNDNCQRLFNVLAFKQMVNKAVPAGVSCDSKVSEPVLSPRPEKKKIKKVKK